MYTYVCNQGKPVSHWLNASALVSINEDTLHRAQIILG